jgi:hypothetical protein
VRGVTSNYSAKVAAVVGREAARSRWMMSKSLSDRRMILLT